MLDTKTINIAVVAAAAQGAITGLIYWHQGLAAWLELNPLSPPQLAQNSDLYLGAGWVNTGSADLCGHIDLEVIFPDQSRKVVAATQNQDLSASPGNGWIVAFDKVTLSQMGNYQAAVTLSSL